FGHGGILIIHYLLILFLLVTVIVVRDIPMLLYLAIAFLLITSFVRRFLAANNAARNILIGILRLYFRFGWHVCLRCFNTRRENNVIRSVCLDVYISINFR